MLGPSNLDLQYEMSKPGRSASKLYLESEAQRRVFACRRCAYKTDRKNNLKRHIAAMHEVTAQKLECCSIKFLSKADLKIHNERFHVEGYKCPVCGQHFVRKALLERHFSVHTGQKKFGCECGYKTSHKSNLERHYKTHLKDRSSHSQRRDIVANAELYLHFLNSRENSRHLMHDARHVDPSRQPHKSFSNKINVSKNFVIPAPNTRLEVRSSNVRNLVLLNPTVEGNPQNPNGGSLSKNKIKRGFTVKDILDQDEEDKEEKEVKRYGEEEEEKEIRKRNETNRKDIFPSSNNSTTHCIIKPELQRTNPLLTGSVSYTNRPLPNLPQFIPSNCSAFDYLSNLPTTTSASSSLPTTSPTKQPQSPPSTFIAHSLLSSLEHSPQSRSALTPPLHPIHSPILTSPSSSLTQQFDNKINDKNNRLQPINLQSLITSEDLPDLSYDSSLHFNTKIKNERRMENEMNNDFGNDLTASTSSLEDKSENKSQKTSIYIHKKWRLKYVSN